MVYIDYVIMGLLFISSIIGFIKGYKGKISNKITLLISMVLSFVATKEINSIVIQKQWISTLETQFEIKIPYPSLISFIIIFLICLLLSYLMFNFIEKNVKINEMSFLNRLLGMISTTLICCVILICILISLHGLSQYLDILKQVIVGVKQNPITRYLLNFSRNIYDYLIGGL